MYECPLTYYNSVTNIFLLFSRIRRDDRVVGPRKILAARFLAVLLETAKLRIEIRSNSMFLGSDKNRDTSRIIRYHPISPIPPTKNRLIYDLLIIRRFGCEEKFWLNTFDARVSECCRQKLAHE